MATTVQTPATKAAKGIPMTSTRKTALVAGVFYLITFVSIPTLALYGPVKNHRDWILSSGGHTGVLVGGFLEVIVALAGIGTAVTLYPVVKRQNEGAALGFVAARVLEAGMIFTGVVSLLSLVTLRQDLGGAAGANRPRWSPPARRTSRSTTGRSCSARASCRASTHCCWALVYRSRLVPRIIPVIGLIGAPFLICTVIATLFGGMKLGSPELAAVPVAAWELSSACGWSSRASALPDHRRNRRGQHAARLPGRRRLTVAQHGRALPGARPCMCRRLAWPVVGVDAHRTRRTGRIATAPMMAQSPATIYSTP